jgi:hypothetical protein
MSTLIVIKKYFGVSMYDAACLLAMLGILFIPFPFNIFPFQSQITELIFGKVIIWVSEDVFGIYSINPNISSDSFSMCIIVLILIIISAIVSLSVNLISRWNLYRVKVSLVFYYIFSYYLAMQLMKYGFDKVFKSQFYLPEPNILYTPVGQVSKDLLFWSSMGTSYFYNLFGGITEVIAGVLIFFNRTKVTGLLLAAGIMINVTAINFGFDISVKIYSSFLLFLSLLLLYPWMKSLYRFLILQKSSILKLKSDSFEIFNRRYFKIGVKAFISGIILLEVFYPSMTNQNFNDDVADRPFLHGAYEVNECIINEEPIRSDISPVRRFFIHRNGYIIFQDHNDQMKDFRFEVDKDRKLFLLTDYQLNRINLKYIYKEEGVLEIQYISKGQEFLLKAKSLNWKKLPLMQNDFHLIVDE